MGICMDCISIPGMSGMGDCLICAWMEGAANRTSENNGVASLWGMVIPSLEDSMVGVRRSENAAGRTGKRGIRFEGLCVAGEAAILLDV
jgi:hypothetical protein